MGVIGFDVTNLFYSIVVFKPEMLKARNFFKTISQKAIIDFLRETFGNLDS